MSIPTLHTPPVVPGNVRPGPYSVQTEFYYGHDNSTFRVDARSAQGLVAAIALARRIYLTPRSLHITAVSLQEAKADPVPLSEAPAPINPFEIRPDPEVLAAVRRFPYEDRFRVVVKDLVEAFAWVQTDMPSWIFLDSQVQKTLGLHMEHYGPDADCTVATILEVTIIIAHEMQHAYRLQYSPAPDCTPPRIRPPHPSVMLQERPGVDAYFGEGGAFWEYNLVGAMIARDEQVILTNPPFQGVTSGIVLLESESFDS